MLLGKRPVAFATAAGLYRRGGRRGYTVARCRHHDGAAAWLLSVVFRMVDTSEKTAVSQFGSATDTMTYEHNRPSRMVLIEQVN